MKANRPGIAVTTAALVENHSYLTGLLALLCLLFAVNFFLTGPGSDGGSGLGGTGRFGGESGLGGTGKTPDSGPGFKLGAADNEDLEYRDSPDTVTPASPSMEIMESLLANLSDNDRPVLDIDSLRLSPAPPAPGAQPTREADRAIAELVAGINLENQANPAQENQDLEQVFAAQVNDITTDTLVASIDILNNLMLAEAQTRMALAAGGPEAAQAVEEAAAIRSRLDIPVRPERPDRFTMPTRITPVQRVNGPAPPPVRPMRTLSTLLGK